MTEKQRKIIHVDMDAFYAAIEQRDNPACRGKPVIVGGAPDKRGVVATCSYEARKFGIHSAMPSRTAYKLCPQAIFLRPRFDVYRDVSRQINEIFHEWTDLVEPLSFDEAFLDVTENKKNQVSATFIAADIRARIREVTGLTASAGVAANKFLAKVASDINKPDGMTVITPDKAEAFVAQLPVGKFFGIGKVTEKRLNDLGIFYGRDLKDKKRREMKELFGKGGDFFYNIVRGIDNRPVNPYRERKSLGTEDTFNEDITDRQPMLDYLRKASDQVGSSLQKRELSGKTVTLKVKYADFQQVTRSRSTDHGVSDSDEIYETASQLLDATEAGERPVRLLGVTVSNFIGEDEDGEEKEVGDQLDFFSREQGSGNGDQNG